VKNHSEYNEMALSWEKLWRADKLKEGPVILTSYLVGIGVKDKYLKFLRKGKRGMLGKPIDQFPPILKTSKSSEA
jgi:hypothetical protein